MSSVRFQKFCWAALAFVVAVILWGAYVRASGSGAGCGSHWPTCNGEIIPLTGGKKTFVEFGHRVTSGASALMVLVMLLWSRREHEAGHIVRSAAAWSAVFMVIEVLVGAGIVLLEYVADDKSIARAVWMVGHMVNTFALVGAMTLTAHFASGAPALQLRGAPKLLTFAGLSTIGTLFVAASGAVAALGDTLFPAKDLGTALAADLSPTAHVLVRLRIVHPFAAVAVAIILLATRYVIATERPSRAVLRFGMWLRVLVVSQIAAGFVNLVLLAPIWMQIVHLLLADVLWITLVLFVASAFATQPEPEDEEPLGEAAEAPG